MTNKKKTQGLLKISTNKLQMLQHDMLFLYYVENQTGICVTVLKTQPLICPYYH